MTRGTVPWVVRSVRDWSLSAEHGMALVTYRSGRAREQAIQELAVEFERNSWRSETLSCAGWTAQEFVDRISKNGAEVLFVLDPDRVLFGENNENSPFWISFHRETIVDRPGVQIWWMLPKATIRFGLELPDVSRFFLFREDLAQGESAAREGLGDLEIEAPRAGVSGNVEQGRDLLARALRAGALEADAGRVWLELGIPAIEAFVGAGEIEQAAEALRQISGQVGPPEEALRPRMGKADAGVGRALWVLGNLYAELGHREAALARAEEAAGIYGELAAENPEVYRADLGGALNDLANALSDLGRREEALAQAEEAVRIYRQLAEARPEAFLPDLGMSLNNLANRLSGLGRREEALAQAEEAVRVYRQLAEARPEAFLPALGTSVNNLANRLSDLGLREEALAQAEEAVRIYRQLAEARPDAFLPDLARSLAVRGRVLAEEQPGLAMASFSEAMRLLTPAFSRYPQAFAGLMRWIRDEYLKVTEAAGADSDEGLLAPVNTVFEGMKSSAQG